MTDKNIRKKKIVRASAIGIASNVILTIVKTIIGLFSGSIAIILDAVNNLTDSLSAILTLVGIKLASKPADKEHPFGHGRYEYLTTIAVSIVIIVLGGAFIFQSFKKIFNPIPAEYDVPGIIILVLAVFTKVFLSAYYTKVGKEVNSETLIDTGVDAKFDVVITSMTLIFALVTMIFGASVSWLDGLLGIFISIMILKAGLEMLISPISELLGERIDYKRVAEIKKAIQLHSEVLGVYDIMLHNYGHEQLIGSLNIGVRDNMTAHEIYDLSRKIQKDIFKQFGIFFNIGIYVENYSDPEVAPIYEKIIDLLKRQEHVIQVHGVYIDPVDKTISFDTVVDFEVKDMGGFRKYLASVVKKEFPDYDIDNIVDLDYSTTE